MCECVASQSKIVCVWGCVLTVHVIYSVVGQGGVEWKPRDCIVCPVAAVQTASGTAVWRTLTFSVKWLHLKVPPLGILSSLTAGSAPLSPSPNTGVV